MGIWANSFKRSCKPQSRMTGSAWADNFRIVPPGTSPEPGPWRTVRTPYLREIVDAATDKKTERVVFCASSQVGKSEMLLNVLGYYADQEPAPQLMLQPTVEMAEAFSKERIEPMFQYSPGLKGKLEEGKDGRGSSRKSNTTIRMKHFPGGYLALVGANSPAGLASRPIRVLLADEVDRYGTTKEGDPLKLATQRTQNFHNRKIVIVSTPTVKGISKIQDWYERSDMREFYVPCPHCGTFHILKWANVHWDKDEKGVANPKSAFMVCPECGAVIRKAFKPDLSMLSKGEWRPTNPGATIRGYHINALYSPWVNLYELVEEWLDANKNKDKTGLQEFINLKLGEPWEEISPDADKWEHLHNRREYYPSDDILPDGVLLLTAGVDVQHNRLECSVYGWGMGRECWGIEHRIIYGKPDDKSTWDQLDALLQKQYQMANGIRVTIACTLVDSGDGEYTTNVYNYTKARERIRVFSSKGRGGIGVPLFNNPTKSNSAGALLFSLGVDSGKSLVYNRLAVEDEGPGYVHYAMQAERGFNENFFKQLTAEVLEKKFEKGVMKMSWVQIRERNEALDCAVYATAAMEILNPNFEYLYQFYKEGGAKQSSSQPRTRARGTISRGVSL